MSTNASTGIPEILRDKDGRRYKVKIDENACGFRLALHKDGVMVAYANLLTQGDTLFVADLLVRHDVVRTGTLLRCLPKAMRTQNFRGRGLGGRMLDVLKAYAKKRGMKRLEGKLSAGDLKAWAGLQEWYRRNGFLVVKDANDVAKSVYHLIA